MDPESMSEALDAIWEEAQRLRRQPSTPEAAQMVELIIAIAAFKRDIRQVEEITITGTAMPGR